MVGRFVRSSPDWKRPPPAHLAQAAVDERAEHALAVLDRDAPVAAVDGAGEGFDPVVGLVEDQGSPLVQPRQVGQRLRIEAPVAGQGLLDVEQPVEEPASLLGARHHLEQVGQLRQGGELLVAVDREASRPLDLVRQHLGDARQARLVELRLALQLDLERGQPVAAHVVDQALGVAVVAAQLLRHLFREDRVGQPDRVAQDDRFQRPRGQAARKAPRVELAVHCPGLEAEQVVAQRLEEGAAGHPAHRVHERALDQGDAEPSHQTVRGLGGHVVHQVAVQIPPQGEGLEGGDRPPGPGRPRAGRSRAGPPRPRGSTWTGSSRTTSARAGPRNSRGPRIRPPRSGAAAG